MSTGITFGNWLKQRRQHLEMTQQQLADCASCSLIAIRKLEADERRPSVQLAEQFARCLQIAPDSWATFIAFARGEGEAPAPSPAAQQPQVEPAVIAEPTPPPSTNLPAPVTSLLGRDQEIDAVCDLLLQPEIRLCTLTGPGGIGKTRLALEVARHLWQTQPARFADGVYFVDLAAVEDPQLVLAVIATTLAVKETPGSTRADSLKSFLQSRHILLVLDNLEQIVEAGADLVQLLEAAPALRLIVTSRTVLQVYGEQEFPVPPLPLPRLEQLPPTVQLQDYAAIALFVERARAVRSDLMITAESGAAIAELCVRLDGLPLAIELAAARCKLFTPQLLLNQLARRLDFLATPNRGIADRQRTLRRAIDWSFHLLDDVEKRLFARLGVFAGEFTLEAAQAVISDQSSVNSHQSSLNTEHWLLNTDDYLLDALTALVNHSMVQHLSPTAPDETMPRFRLLLTLREYALEQLAAQGEQQESQTRHAGYYLSLAEKAAPELEGARQTYWFERFSAEHDNLRSALAWGLQTAGQQALSLRLATALARFWFVRGHLAEGRRWLAQALDKSEDVAPSLRAAALTAAGMLARFADDHAEAMRRLQAALAIWQSLGEAADQAGLARVYMSLGGVAWSQEDHSKGRGYFEAALAIQRKLGNLAGVAGALHNLGLEEQYQGHFAVAQAYMEECIQINRQIGNYHGLSLALNSLGTLHQELGEYATARACLAESLAIARSMHDKDRMAMVLNNLGNVALSEGSLAEAKTHYDESLDCALEVEARISTAFAYFGLGMFALLQQDDATAHRQMSQALVIWHEFKMKRVILRVLDCMALYCSRHGQPEKALALLGFAEVLREGHLLPPRAPAFLPFYKQAVANTRGRLTPAQFVAAWQQGRDLRLEEAVKLALAKNQQT